MDGGDAFVVLGDLLGGHRATPDDHSDRLVLLLRQRHLESETAILENLTNFVFLGKFFFNTCGVARRSTAYHNQSPTES